MWTIRDTNDTTNIIITVSGSIRKPISKRRLPEVAHVYSAPLKVLPFTMTSCAITQLASKATATPRMVAVWAPARPMVLPNRPASSAPASGASGTSR